MIALIKLSRFINALLPIVATIAAVFVVLAQGQVIAGLLLYIASILLAIEHHVTEQNYKERLAEAIRLKQRKEELK